MDRKNPFFNQVSLLVRVLPFIANHPCFAMKGGTAINLFYRDLPRLSVDIDLVYVPVCPREESLREISRELKALGEEAERLLPDVRIQHSCLHQSTIITRLIIKAEKTIVKVEVSPVLRGTVYPVQVKRIVPSAEKDFGFAEVPVVSFEDLFAGKILAALDRQHPRDLFDIKYLLENEGITARLKTAFLVYLISHDRSMSEILDPTLLYIGDLYRGEFSGMTTIPVTIEELELVRSRLCKVLVRSLDQRDKAFLISFKEGNPDWSVFPMAHIKELPAVKWKLHNLAQLDSNKRAALLRKLEKVLL